jgi:hypothetical protein
MENTSTVLITIFLFVVIITLPATMTTTTINRVYGQQPDQMDLLNVTDSSPNIQNMTVQKVHVGDIDIAYKMFGKGDPIILFNGASDNMDAWDRPF